MSDDLKYIVINDESYLVEEVVYNFHLCLSKENERLREVIKDAHDSIDAGDDFGGYQYLDAALKEIKNA